MAKERIKFSDISAGKPLPWDVFDATGKLLLSKGNRLEDESQVEELIARGVFFEGSGQRPHEALDAARKEAPSALRAINLATNRLAKLLNADSQHTNFHAGVMQVAQEIISATAINPDVVAACVLHNRHAAYPIRHSIDTASISLLVARAMHLNENDILSLVSAGLTMDIATIRKTVASEVEDFAAGHPEEALNFLRQAGVNDATWLELVRFQHTDSPPARREADIPVGARIISTSSAYCSRICNFGNGNPICPSTALREIFIARAQQSSQSLAPFFVKAFGLYPPGTCVRLANGETGVVSKVGETATTPQVHSLIGPHGAPLAYAIRRDTARPQYAVKDAISQDAANFRFSMQQIWGEDASL